MRAVDTTRISHVPSSIGSAAPKGAVPSVLSLAATASPMTGGASLPATLHAIADLVRGLAMARLDAEASEARAEAEASVAPALARAGQLCLTRGNGPAPVVESGSPSMAPAAAPAGVGCSGPEIVDPVASLSSEAVYQLFWADASADGSMRRRVRRWMQRQP